MIQSFYSLEMLCLYSKYTTLATQGFLYFCVCIHMCVFVFVLLCVCALSETMTTVSEVLKDLEANQLPGYWSLFVGLQFSCRKI